MVVMAQLAKGREIFGEIFDVGSGMVDGRWSMDDI
jgi:hypothetical protein